MLNLKKRTLTGTYCLRRKELRSYTMLMSDKMFEFPSSEDKKNSLMILKICNRKPDKRKSIRTMYRKNIQ